MDAIEELLGTEYDPSLEPVSPGSVPGGRAQTAARRRDLIRGMLLGVALGDALGAPHEFANQIPLEKYTGVLEHPLLVCRRFQGGKLKGNVGQITDDTEMTIALADAICRRRGYDRGAAIAGYLEWANSKCPFMGRNTRALFVGVKTIKGYEGRHAALCAEPRVKWSQSNGCLMRCAPLAALPDTEWGGAVALDSAATNPHPVCVDAVRAYVCAARELLAGETAAAATAKALVTATTDEVIAAIATGRDQEPQDVSSEKGWVVHAVYCAFLALNGPEASFQDRIDRIERLGGDPDTNGAIAGALLGAQLGEAAMRAETRTGANIERVLANDPATGGLPRPKKYAASRLLSLADLLADLA